MIHMIRTPATQQQIDERMQSLETSIQLAVDIERGILARFRTAAAARRAFV